MTQQTPGHASLPRGPQLIEVMPVPPLDLIGMFRAVWNGKWVIVLATICCVALAGYYSFRMVQPQFGATATLQVDLQPANLPSVARPLPSPGTDVASLNTQVAVLKSNQLLGQVVHQLELLTDPEFNRYLTPASPLSRTTLRRRLRNLLAGTEDVPPDAAAIFEKTIQNLRNVLAVEQPRDTYIFRISARSRSAEKAALIANTLAAVYLMDQVHAKDAASQEAEDWLSSRVDDLQTQLQMQETAITSLISTAQIQEDTALDNLSNQVLVADQQLDAARGALALIETASRTPSTPRLEAEAMQQRTQIASLSSQRDRLLSQLSAQSEGLAELHQMQRQADATRVLYETLLARLQETRIQRGLENPDSRLIAAATAGTYSGPRKTLILTISVVVGVMIGLALVTLKHTLRTGVLDAITLRRETGMPVVAQIAQSKTHGSRQLRKRIKRGKPVFGSAMQSLRTALSIATKGPPPKTVMLTSTVAGEGKSAYAIALAQSFTHSGKSVLLLATDIGNTKIQTVLNWPPDVGIGDVLFGELQLTDIITHNSNLKTDILHVGFGENVLLTDGFANLLKELTDRYDHIIIDAPPVMTAPEAQLLAQSADSIIYCVAWAKTPLALVQMGLDALQVADAPATGLILSKISERKMQRMGATSYLGTAGISAAT